MTTEERWLPVLGFEGYEVSDHGRVRSFLQRNNRGRVLKQSCDKKGYPYVGLMSDGGLRTRRVHTLVLEAFVGPCPAGLIGLHSDDDKSNNHVTNLRWGTHAQNYRDSIINGSRLDTCKRGHELVQRANGSRSCRECNNALSRESKRRAYVPRMTHLTDEQKAAIRQDPRASRVVAEDYGVSHATIQRVRKVAV